MDPVSYNSDDFFDHMDVLTVLDEIEDDLESK